ncbi:hypothetical protein QJS66_10370 [Kocuria rhizophila]|nr:hypothetical protein QJS66_10370 [Kocuria rhizophila]
MVVMTWSPGGHARGRRSCSRRTPSPPLLEDVTRPRTGGAASRTSSSTRAVAGPWPDRLHAVRIPLKESGDAGSADIGAGQEQYPGRRDLPGGRAAEPRVHEHVPGRGHNSPSFAGKGHVPRSHGYTEYKGLEDWRAAGQRGVPPATGA